MKIKTLNILIIIFLLLAFNPFIAFSQTRAVKGSEERVINTILTRTGNTEIINANTKIDTAIAGGSQVIIPLHTKEVIGTDQILYRFEIVAEGRNFYKDTALLAKIEALAKLAKAEGEHSILNSLNTVRNEVGHRDSLSIEKALYPATEPITTETRLRVWVNKNEANEVATETIYAGKTKGEVFKAELENIVNKPDIEIPQAETKDENTDEDLAPECQQSDFIAKANFTPTEKTIRCRLCYKSLNNPRNELEKPVLKQNHDKVNEIRVFSETAGPSPISRNKNKNRVFGFANVRVDGILQPQIKMINGTTEINGFAPIIQEPRIYPLSEVLIESRKDDAEVRVLEYIAR